MLSLAPETSAEAEWVDPFERAACRHHSVDMTEEIEGDFVAQWALENHQKAVCDVCPVRQHCLETVLTENVHPLRFWGVRAGMTRSDYRRNRRRNRSR